MQNPLYYRQLHFFKFYVLLCLAMFALAAAVRRLRRRAKSPKSLPELSAYELAYLSGGAKRTTRAAIVSLATQKMIELGGSRELSITQNLAKPTDDLERDVLDAIRSSPMPSQRLAIAPEPFHRIDHTLVTSNLLLPERRARFSAWICLLLSLFPVLIGLARCALDYHRRVGFGMLLIFCGVTAALSLAIFAVPLRRTALGDRLLQRARSTAQAEQPLPRRVALLGVSALHATAVAWLIPVLMDEQAAPPNNCCDA